MKTITLTIDKLPTGVSVTSTSWQVYKTRAFIAGDGDVNKIVDITDDTANKESYSFEYDFAPGEVLYARYKHNYGGGTEDAWSYPIQVSEAVLSPTYTGTVLGTPVLTSTYKITDSHLPIYVESEGIVNFQGVTGLKATSWYMKDLAGNILWQREYDTVDKTHVTIPGMYLLGNEVVVISAKHFGDDGSTSNLGRITVVKEPANAFINLVVDKEKKDRLCVNRPNSFTFDYSDFGVTQILYKLVEKDGPVVDEGKVIDPAYLQLKTITVKNDNIKSGHVYTLHVTINLDNGETMSNEFYLVSEFCVKECKTTVTLKNVIESHTTTLDYKSKQSMPLTDGSIPHVVGTKLRLFDFNGTLALKSPNVDFDVSMKLNTNMPAGQTSIYTEGNNIFVVGESVNDSTKYIIVKYIYYPGINAISEKAFATIDKAIFNNHGIELLMGTFTYDGVEYDLGIRLPNKIRLLDIDTSATLDVGTDVTVNVDNGHLVQLCDSLRIVRMDSTKLSLYNTLSDAASIASVVLDKIDTSKTSYLVARNAYAAYLVAWDTEHNAYGVYFVTAGDNSLEVKLEISGISLTDITSLTILPHVELLLSAAVADNGTGNPETQTRYIKD